MTTPIDPLLSSADFARFQAKDPDWFLGAVGEEIRDYCGWHIFPIASITNYQAKIGNKGIIMLPTTRLVSVEQIVYDAPNVLDASMFEVIEDGWLEFKGYLGRRGRNLRLTVDYTAGYDDMPTPVAEVGFELTATVLEKASGVATEVQRGPSSFKFKEFGVVLSEDQKSRLGPYRAVRL